jgi:hypothetical protein
MSHAFFCGVQKVKLMENTNTQSLEPSEEMKEFMKLHNMTEFSEVLKIKPEKLMKMEGFGWRLLKEYVKETKEFI